MYKHLLVLSRHYPFSSSLQRMFQIAWGGASQTTYSLGLSLFHTLQNTWDFYSVLTPTALLADLTFPNCLWDITFSMLGKLSVLFLCNFPQLLVSVDCNWKSHWLVAEGWRFSHSPLAGDGETNAVSTSDSDGLKFYRLSCLILFCQES